MRGFNTGDLWALTRVYITHKRLDLCESPPTWSVTVSDEEGFESLRCDGVLVGPLLRVSRVASHQVAHVGDRLE